MSAIVGSVTITSPTQGAVLSPSAPFLITGTTTGAVTLVEVRLTPPGSTVGQPYLPVTPGAGGYGTWSISLTAENLANTRIIARGTLIDNTQVWSRDVIVSYSGTITPPPPPAGTASMTISSPAANSTFVVTNPLAVSGVSSGVSNVEVTLKDPTSLVSPFRMQTYQAATPGPLGWSTWSTSILPAHHTYTTLMSRATLVSDGITHIWSDPVPVRFTGTVVTPPPPDPIPDPDPVPPPPPPSTSIWNKLKGMLPVGLQPYALPIVVGAVGLVMMKGGIGGIFRRGGGGGGYRERYRTYVSGVR